MYIYTCFVITCKGNITPPSVLRYPVSFSKFILALALDSYGKIVMFPQCKPSTMEMTVASSLSAQKRHS